MPQRILNRRTKELKDMLLVNFLPSRPILTLDNSNVVTNLGNQISTQVV